MSAWDSTVQFFSDMPWSMLGVWGLTLCLLLVGLVGSVVPLLPGPVLIAVAGVVHTLLRPESGMGLWGFIIMAVLLILSFVLDFVSGAVGAKWFGASRWGVAGVFLGGIVGMFFMPFGLVLGPLFGGIVFELLFAKKQLQPAAKSAWGSVLGTGVGMVLRLLIAMAMIATFFIDALWW